MLVSPITNTWSLEQKHDGSCSYFYPHVSDSVVCIVTLHLPLRNNGVSIASDATLH